MTSPSWPPKVVGSLQNIIQIRTRIQFGQLLAVSAGLAVRFSLQTFPSISYLSSFSFIFSSLSISSCPSLSLWDFTINFPTMHFVFEQLSLAFRVLPYEFRSAPIISLSTSPRSNNATDRKRPECACVCDYCRVGSRRNRSMQKYEGLCQKQ